jgi:hypothetical protein
MNKRETAIITAFTGISFGGKLFPEFHKYAEEKFGHPIWTHEMASENFWEKLKELSKNDFINLVENIEI